MHIETLRWEGDRPGHVQMVEQTLLPLEHVEIAVRTVPEMVDAIYRLAVRGAPAIGVSAAYGVLLGIQEDAGMEAGALVAKVGEVCDTLAAARPTAVNLFWALNRMRAKAEKDHAGGANGEGIVSGLFEEAHAIFHGDRDTCRRMGEIGAELIHDGDTLLTHCNAGALATAGMGTALAPMYVAKEQGKTIHVFADETRPLLQGARITAFELMHAGIDVTLITDGMAARVMFEGKVDAVFVGSDRIARNGDVCNKIGTYSVALAAQAHDVPFYVVAPLSTVDPSLDSGDLIPIEERAPEEITEGFGKRTAPEGVKVYSPAFDITPARLITGIITEVGLIEQPTMAKMEDALRRGGVDLSGIETA
ncbi:MAG: S-methyl-5-thioribose-1-phosphate isomerase [Planctomycetota bacterium]|nr:S-methyl-5-thioribose-1-phosphate isomerase [Planctomycetota bacterium]